MGRASSHRFRENDSTAEIIQQFWTHCRIEIDGNLSGPGQEFPSLQNADNLLTSR
jgi:hypothetical protein